MCVTGTEVSRDCRTAQWEGWGQEGTGEEAWGLCLPFRITANATGPLESGEKTSDCDDALGMPFCWRFSKAGWMRVTWDLSQADGEGGFPDHPG